MSNQRKLGRVNTGPSCDTLALISCLVVLAGAWLKTSLTEISAADVREAVAH